MKNKRIFFILLLVFLAANLIFTINYLSNDSATDASGGGVGKRVVYTVDQAAAGADDRDRITLKLKIFDIFRLDISCDYILTALAERIDDRYRNDDKKCALASGNKNVNLAVDKSYAKTTNDFYEPILDPSVAFSPFDIKLLNATPPFGQLRDLAAGGLWSPRFSSPNRVCSEQDVEFIVFIVPYTQSRYENLKLFLLNMHSYLQKLRRPFKYRIVVAEQVPRPGRRQVLFNKGRVLNTAIKYAMDTFERIDCIVIHDVDILPIWDSYSSNDSADYRCNIMPVHLTKRVLLLKTRQTRLYNQFLTGGVLSLRPHHILAANGYSNEYFGWGGEDDDWTLRMFNKDLCIMRPKDDSQVTNGPAALSKTNSIRKLGIKDPDLYKAFFLMLDHAPSQANSKRFNSLTNALSNQMYDGINTIEGLTRVVKAVDHRAFTHLQIEVV